jgi:Sec-independent protein translocase protein TatA
MSSLLKLVPEWALAAVVGLLFLGLQQLRVSDAQASAAEAKASLSSFKTEVAERDRRAALSALNETKRRLGAAGEIDSDAESKLAQAEDDAGRASDALQRLQQRVAIAELRVRQCGNTITSQLGASADAEARMRAELLGRIGTAVQFYAGVADDNRIRGSTCEARYDSLTP